MHPGGRSEMPNAPWDRVLQLAWEGFCARTAPIGAVVVDAAGTVVAEARGRRFDDAGPPGELAGCRIAHAELNALAKLPVAGYYHECTLYASVEPCCLCMGAAIQTGVGSVNFAWRDPYAGATAMVVPNVQAQLKNTQVVGPAGGAVQQLAGLLLAAHYVIDDAAKPHVSTPMRDQDPHLFAAASEGSVRALLTSGRDAEVPFAEIRPTLETLL